MPILMLALVALVTFGLIGLILALAVVLEQKKANPKHRAPARLPEIAQIPGGHFSKKAARLFRPRTWPVQRVTSAL